MCIAYYRYKWFISVIQVYSVTCNPVDSQQLCLTGRDSHLRIYDLRKPHLATSFLTPPSLPIDTETNPNMAAYSDSGKELAVSYDFLSHTDKRIYIFPTSANTGCAPSRVCWGYGVNDLFGPWLNVLGVEQLQRQSCTILAWKWGGPMYISPDLMFGHSTYQFWICFNRS